ncbi:MAG: aminotransferase class V-fold PLP-dependent enzyme [Ilumatobacteraceae bacterium]
MNASRPAVAGALTAEEIDDARALTPGCAADRHRVHLNHAGCSLPPRTVIDAQLSYLQAEALEGGYEVAAGSVGVTDAVYDSIGRLIGAQPHEIARFEHATAAWNAAFWSLPMDAGQRILVHDHEYGANAVAFVRATETRGVVIDRVPSDSTGQVSVDAMATALAAGDVALVSLTHVPTNGGLVNPAAEIGALTRAAGVPYLVDACQSVGQLAIDVQAIGCDFLSATGRKYLRGPRGTGFLYVADSILDRAVPAHPDHHGADLVAVDRYELMPDARRFEYWEYNHAAWHGLGAAVDHTLWWGIDRIEATVTQRAAELRGLLREAGFVVHDQGARQCGIVTTTSADPAGPSAQELWETLTRHGVNSSVTMVGSSRYDVERRNLPPLLRLSVHYTTTSAELADTVAILARA